MRKFLKATPKTMLAGILTAAFIVTDTIVPVYAGEIPIMNNTAEAIETKEQNYLVVNGTSAKVTASACLTDQADDPLNYDNFKYTVSINGVYSRKLNFNIGGTQSGTISGLQKGGTYTVTISTGESVPGNGYLQGSGKIVS